MRGKKPKKVGRPSFSNGKAKSIVLQARVRPSERAAYVNEAKTKGVDLSTWVRETLNRSIMVNAMQQNDKLASKLVGQFCRTSAGDRVFVESVGASSAGLPARAVVRRIEGPNTGSRAGCFVSDLTPLGYETPINEPRRKSKHVPDFEE